MLVDEAKLHFQSGNGFQDFFDLGDNLSIAIQKQFGYRHLYYWVLLQNMECRFKQEVLRVEFLNFVGFLKDRELYLPIALVWLIGSIAFSCIACLT